MKHKSLLTSFLGSRWICASCSHQAQNSKLHQIPTLIFGSGNRRRTRGLRLQNDAIERRLIHTTRYLFHDAERQRQAMPLGDFYTDLLASPLPKKPERETDLPSFVQSGGDKTKEERAKLLFGSIEGSGYERHTFDRPDATWRTINGVPVPPRPAEPENCCMSGCVHCVWDDYRDDVEDWAGRLAAAQAKSPKKRAPGGSPKSNRPRPEVDHASGSMDDDGGGSESLWTTPSSAADEADQLFQGIPVGIREFMATEKRIKDRRRAKRDKGVAKEDDLF